MIMKAAEIKLCAVCAAVDFFHGQNQADCSLLIWLIASSFSTLRGWKRQVKPSMSVNDIGVKTQKQTVCSASDYSIYELLASTLRWAMIMMTSVASFHRRGLHHHITPYLLGTFQGEKLDLPCRTDVGVRLCTQHILKKQNAATESTLVLNKVHRIFGIFKLIDQGLQLCCDWQKDVKCPVADYILSLDLAPEIYFSTCIYTTLKLVTESKEHLDFKKI